MNKHILIVDSATTLAVRVKLLLSLHGCDVQLVHYAEYRLQELKPFYDWILIEQSIDPHSIPQLKTVYMFSHFMLLHASQIQTETAIYQQLPHAIHLFNSDPNHKIIELLEQFDDETHSLAIDLPEVGLINLAKEEEIFIEKILLNTRIKLHNKEIDLNFNTKLAIDIAIIHDELLQIEYKEAFTRFRYLHPNCHFILLTQNHQLHLHTEYHYLGIDYILYLPLEETLLLQAIYQLWQLLQLQEKNKQLSYKLQDYLDGLIEQDMFQRVIFDNTPDGIIVFTAKGIVLEANHSCDYLFATSNEKLKQSVIDHWFSTETGQTLCGLLSENKADHLFSVDLTLTDQEGLKIPVSASITTIEYQGEVVYAGIIRNISHLRSQQELLAKDKDRLQQLVAERTVALEGEKNRALKANQAKTTFLANMSHELRTPMHSILSFTQFSLDLAQIAPPSIKEKLSRYQSRIKTSGQRLLKLINNLLDLSKLESGQIELYYELINMEQLLERCIDEINSLLIDKDIDCKVEITTADKVQCDKEKIQQVLLNLLGNAIKFSPKKSTIIVKISSDCLVQGQKTVNVVRVDVIDEGVGIPEAELPDIFGKFIQSTRTNQGAGGTGLGLAICAEIVHLHQGKMIATNNTNIGTCFSFFLPIIPFD